MILTVTLNAAIDKRYVVDHFNVDEVNRASECVYFAGGKGLNVSRAATIAGSKVVATGFVGGHAGEFILEELKKQGIEADFVKVNGESRSCLNIYDPISKTQTEILEPGVDITPLDIERFLDKYIQLVSKADVVSISGSVPKGVGTDLYPKLVSIAKEAGKKVIVDTSGAQLEEMIRHSPNMIKPNSDEIRMLTGIKTGFESKSVETSSNDIFTVTDPLKELCEAGSKMVDDGIEQVVISLGSDGALMIRKDGVYRASVPRIDAVNTVGCGDCMTAGFAIGFERGLSPEDTLRLSSAISCAAAMTEETGSFRLEDYEKIKDRIVIGKIL